MWFRKKNVQEPVFTIEDAALYAEWLMATREGSTNMEFTSWKALRLHSHNAIVWLDLGQTGNARDFVVFTPPH